MSLPLSVAGKKGKCPSCDAVNVITSPGSTSPLQQPIQTGAYTNPDAPHFGSNNGGDYPNGHAISRQKFHIVSLAAMVLIFTTLVIVFTAGDDKEIPPESGALSSTVPQPQIKKPLTGDVFNGLKGPARVMQAIYETFVLAESFESDALHFIREYFPDPDDVVSGEDGKPPEELKVMAEQYANSLIDDWIRIISKAMEGVSPRRNEEGIRIKWSEMEVLALIIDHAPSLDDDLQVEGDAVIFLVRENDEKY